MSNNNYKVFLQNMINIKIISTEDAQAMINRIFGNDEVDIDEVIQSINRDIKNFRMEIRKAYDEESGISYYSIVNLVDNPITRSANNYKKEHLEYFKKVVTSIVVSGGSNVISTMNLARSLEENNMKLSITDAGNLLEKWIEDKYLTKSSDKHTLYLGPRSLMELDSYLKEYFPQNITDCNLCKFICVRGTSCDNCFIKLHVHCAENYYDKLKKCPNCGEAKKTC